jgi:uncharacterized membrane protein
MEHGSPSFAERYQIFERQGREQLSVPPDSGRAALEVACVHLGDGVLADDRRTTTVANRVQSVRLHDLTTPNAPHPGQSRTSNWKLIYRLELIYPVRPRAQIKMVATREVAGATIFTAFVFAVTFSFAATTSTGGYFDVGEIMVYITALVMGPYVGAFAGGFGSMLSDALLAPQFAPGTLVIKGAEGFIVGYLGQRGLRELPEGIQRRVGLFFATVVALTVVAIGLVAFPDVSLSLGQFPFTPTTSTPDVQLSLEVWLLLGALAFAATTLASRKIGLQFTWIALAIFAGGAEMVAGYFLYETQLLQIGLGPATAEIPVNALQALLGLMVAPPIAARVQGIFRGSPGSTVMKRAKDHG